MPLCIVPVTLLFAYRNGMFASAEGKGSQLRGIVRFTSNFDEENLTMRKNATLSNQRLAVLTVGQFCFTGRRLFAQIWSYPSTAPVARRIKPSLSPIETSLSNQLPMPPEARILLSRRFGC